MAEQLPLPPALEERLDRLGLEFVVELLRRSAARHPDNLETLSELATLLTRLGRHAEGLEADLRLVRMAPADATVRYNLACSLALTGQKDQALDALERAVELGYGDAKHLLDDADLSSLRGEARFHALIERLSVR